MAWNKAQSKSTSKNKWMESTDSDNEASGSTTSDKSFQSTNASNIWTTNNDAYDNKSESLSNGRLNHLFHFIHSLFKKSNAYHWLTFILTSFRSRWTVQ